MRNKLVRSIRSICKVRGGTERESPVRFLIWENLLILASKLIYCLTFSGLLNQYSGLTKVPKRQAGTSPFIFKTFGQNNPKNQCGILIMLCSKHTIIEWQFAISDSPDARAAKYRWRNSLSNAFNAFNRGRFIVIVKINRQPNTILSF